MPPTRNPSGWEPRRQGACFLFVPVITASGTKDWLLLAAAAAGGLLLARNGRRYPPFSFHDRTVLITGGSRGLGLVLARALLAEGVSGLAICARDDGELERARQALAGGRARVLTVRTDVRDRAQVEALVRVVVSRLGRLDVLINNAGTIAVGPLAAMTLADFEDAMATNFWGAVHATLAALPVMRDVGEGRIVNIASIGGKVSVPHLVPYSASKFALVGFSHGLRAELAAEGIVVTTVCPGLMRTGSPRNAFFKGRHREEYAWFAISDSLPGLSMSAERAARQILAACRRGEAEVVLTVAAGVAATAASLAPEMTSRVLALASRLLPQPGGVGTARMKGSDSESAVAPSLLTALGDAAARQHNQVA